MASLHPPLTRELIRECTIGNFKCDWEENKLYNADDWMLAYERSKMQAKTVELYKLKHSLGRAEWNSLLEKELARLREGDINDIQEVAVYGPNPLKVEYLKTRLA